MYLINKTAGVYCIKNLINSKVYIGSSYNMCNRIKRHLYMLSNNIHSNTHLQSAYNMYGKDSFICDVLEETYGESLLVREYFHINSFNALNRLYGYNMKSHDTVKIIYSSETLSIMSQKKIGNTNRSDTTIYTFYNKLSDVEVKTTRSEFINNYDVSKSCIHKLINGKGKTNKGWICRNPKIPFIEVGIGVHMKGRKLSESHKTSISDSLKKPRN